MPQPLAATLEPPREATQTMPMLVKPVFNIPMGSIKGINGIPKATKGSIVYPAVFSFGFLITGGWDTRGRITRGTMSGREDTKWRKV